MIGFGYLLCHRLLVDESNLYHHLLISNYAVGIDQASRFASFFQLIII
jgi:hypothetical protein